MEPIIFWQGSRILNTASSESRVLNINPEITVANIPSALNWFSSIITVNWIVFDWLRLVFTFLVIWLFEISAGFERLKVNSAWNLTYSLFSIVLDVCAFKHTSIHALNWSEILFVFVFENKTHYLSNVKYLPNQMSEPKLMRICWYQVLCYVESQLCDTSKVWTIL